VGGLDFPQAAVGRPSSGQLTVTKHCRQLYNNIRYH